MSDLQAFTHWLAAVACLVLAAPVVANENETEASPAEATQAVVLKVIAEMPTGGGYVWKSTGVPHDITHREQVVLAKTTADGTYCSGVTFAVVVEAATRLGLVQRASFDRVKQFQRDWYGTHDAAAETQCVYAMKRLRIGRQVRPGDAEPGDFVQYWRNNGSGHSVIFLAWVYKDQQPEGDPIGLRYWSSQTATDGIGEHVEFFDGHAGPDGKPGRVDPRRLYIGRLHDTR